MANKRQPGREKRTPLGTQHVDITLSREVIVALHDIKKESDQGESISQFIDNWLRQHPRVKAKLETQEKGTQQTS